MAVDPNTLLADAVCYACQPGNAWAFKLALLKQILLAVSPMADTSPNALLELAKCYACQPGNAESFELALLKLIVDAGGTGGGGGTGGPGIVGTGSPEGVKTAPVGTSYFDSSINAFWYKKTGAGNTGWVALLM